eukprot:COSAG05_NODE_3215_length_2236_cov_1.485728_1_plen_412_part_00
MLVALLVVPLLSSGTPSTRVVPADPLVQLTGRFLALPAGAVAFDHPGTQITVSVAHTSSVSLELLQERSAPARAGHNVYPAFQPHYFVVLVNGTEVHGFANATFGTAVCQNVTATSILAVDGLDAAAVHTVRIFKSSEAQWAAAVPEPNYLTLQAVILGGGSGGSSAAPELQPPPPRPARRLEFLGDSLMAGYCNLLWVPDIHRHKSNRSNIESFWLSWVTRTCEALGAECHTAAWSGFALTHSHFCSKPVTMPQIWERTLATDGSLSRRWNFGTSRSAAGWQVPAAVIVNLGTNDWHGVPPPSSWGTPQMQGFLANFTTTYHQLVERIVQVYSSQTVIFIAVGPMTMGYLQPALWVVGNATRKGWRVQLLNQSGFSHGDCGHPSWESDRQIAAAARAQIGQALGWDLKVS